MRLTCCLIIVASLAACPRAAVPAEFVWIEGENPQSINVKPDINPSGRPQLLSGGKWLTLHLDPGQIATQLPADGARIVYAFKVAEAGTHAVWGRIGYEFARSPLDWRLDNRPWNTVTPDDVTTDLTELNFFTEVAWFKFGRQDLTAGDHTLEIRIRSHKNAKGELQRLLFGIDVLCLTTGEFLPNGRFKPGEDGRDARDLKAAKTLFAVPEAPQDGRQSALPLAGLWEVCRADEELPGPVAEPIRELPRHPFWRGIEVPGDKNTLCDDLVFAHRLWYRTRVNVPQSQKDRSFYLVFPQNNLNTTVYVNGVYCGFEKHPYVHFQIDVTQGIRPGVNEIWVGIRDAWYGYTASPTDPLKLRRAFNMPLEFSHHGFQDLSYPVWAAFQSGILVTPSLVSAGRAYTSDVFCKPSVARKELALDVTVKNPSHRQVAGQVHCEAVNAKTGAVEKTFAPAAIELAAGEEKVLPIAEKWESPKLWWPDEPNMYRLRATVKAGGAAIDVSETPFGFREWGTDGIHFTLNGQVWHGWNMDVRGENKETWLANYRKLNQTQVRMCGAAQGGNRPLLGMTPDEALDWCDRNGVVVRRCGPLDGEAIGYFAVENDAELKKLHQSEIKLDLLNEWREQMVAQVRGERNHPSVQIWSIENEFLYINCINLYGGLMDQFEAQAVKTAQAVRAIDPTRPVMTDGGGAGKAQGMPVHGDHYIADANLTRYPALAYAPNAGGGGRGRWQWDQKRPRYVGEDFFYTGNHPELSTIGGEAAFGGKTSTLPACGLMLQILQQGYRWADYGAWDFYCGAGDADGAQWKYMAPRVVLCRQWDWSFGSGQQVARKLAIFNDTHSTDPITLTWGLTISGRKVAGETKEYAVAPGTRREVDVTLPMPEVDSRKRANSCWHSQFMAPLTPALSRRERGTKSSPLPPGEGQGWRAACSPLPPGEGQGVRAVSLPSPAGRGAGGEGGLIWSDTKSISVLPQPAADRAVAMLGAESARLRPGGHGRLVSHRPRHRFRIAEKSRQPAGYGATARDRQGRLERGRAASGRLAAWAAPGRTVVVLEQAHPLKSPAFAAAMEPAVNEGRVAFAEDLGHPAFRGFAQKDFFTWSPDEIVFRNAYAKPTRGAKSLVQCGQSLQNSGLVEVPAGKGLLLLSQLVVGEKLAGNAVARTLFVNLLAYGAGYKQVFRPVAVVAVEGSPLAKALAAMGLQYAKADGPLAALAVPGGIAVIDASPENLNILAENLLRVEQFTAAGGFIVFNGLTPAGIESYNKIVGFEHMIRPFKRERVVLPAVRDPLTAGLTTGDVALYSSQRIFSWTEGNYVVSDEFSYVVDYDEVAPFGKSSFFAYDNIVNGFVNADGWPLIINFEFNKDGSPYDVPITLPKPQTITEFTWIGNTNYYPQTKVNLIFDGDRSRMISYDVQPTGDPQALPVDPPRTARQVTVEIAGWQEKPGTRPLIGIDNIYLRRSVGRRSFTKR